MLIVGAGSTGQVFGCHLAQGGARVTFLVRPKYRESAARGFALYPLNDFEPGGEPVRFAGFDVITSAEELTDRKFDQVYLTVSSTALREGWLPQLIATIGDATLVSLQPGPDDHAVLRDAGAHPDRTVCGGIVFVSYAAPLPGETRFPAPGTAYWFPPLARSPFTGPTQRTRAVVAALRRGGLPARRHGNAERLLAFPNAVGMAYLAGLEAAGWSVRELSESQLLPVCRRAAREAIAIMSLSQGRAPFTLRIAARTLLPRATFWLGERALPFPLAAYVRKHFTKVGEQTRLIIASIIARGEAAGVQAQALKHLLASVPRHA